MDSVFGAGVREGEDPVSQDKIVGFLRGGCPRGGGNWGTLRIPFGKIGEP